VDVLAWESFSEEWAQDAMRELKLPGLRIHRADYGRLPDLSGVNSTRDCVFVWNGTTSGVRLTDADWIDDEREGLTICDATSAAFAMNLPWPKLDVVTWSWQKVLGGEAAHGMLALSPRAVARLETHRPAWPLPKIFRLTKAGKLIEGIFQGDTINTPSLLCVEDALDGLRWAESIGGLRALIARSEANLACVAAWVDASPWARFLAEDPRTRSCTSVCLRFQEPPPGGATETARRIVAELEREGVALDVASYRDAPPGLRIWCGATVETSDIEALLPWLDRAYAAATA
jgi:phosphoserine aminotransferase